MGIWTRAILAAVAPLLLTGCLWGPGKFMSELTLRRDGSFTLAYRGEIMLQLPADEPAKPWSVGMARCTADGRAETVEPPAPSPKDDGTAKPRPCSKAELGGLKADYERRLAEQAATKRKQAEEAAKLFGLPGADEESNRAFAAKLMKYAGWRSVRYRSRGLFDVDYRLDGRLTQDFVFPLMPDSDLLVPFVAIRRRADGSVLVTAPALTGSSPFAARARAAGLGDSEAGPPSRAAGRFTVVTDGVILTNNSEDGPAAHPGGRQVHWDIAPGSAKIPEILVRP